MESILIEVPLHPVATQSTLNPTAQDVRTIRPTLFCLCTNHGGGCFGGRGVLPQSSSLTPRWPCPQTYAEARGMPRCPWWAPSWNPGVLSAPPIRRGRVRFNPQRSWVFLRGRVTLKRVEYGGSSRRSRREDNAPGVVLMLGRSSDAEEL